MGLARPHHDRDISRHGCRWPALMRPVLFDVDVSLHPPRMTVCFPGHPLRFVVVHIKAAVTTVDDAKTAAIAEMDGWTPEQQLLVAEYATPAPVVPNEPAMTATITQVEQEDRYTGLVHCPACCRSLGRGDSPAIGYITACPGCQKRLIVRFTPGAFTVIVWPDAWPPDDRPNLSFMPPTITDE
jgi:hypothetical protein